ncbi:MAG TPA: flagellar hook-associated protein FlgL [Gemmatimonadales bacterium]|nr:flagellar hook-associated protein FlgL [Gemmatimonadales bacterium]
MRITNNLLQQRIISGLQTNMSTLAQVQLQMSSGKQYQSIGDNPVVGTQVMYADSALRAINQYRRNTTDAQTRSDAEESVLNQLTDLLSRAKQLATQEGTSTANAQTHAAAAAEIQQILDQVIQLGNTQVGNQYLFAGTQTGQPFDASGNYSGDAGQHQAEIGQGYLITTNHNGKELLVDSGVLSGLQGLLTQLQSGTTAGIAGSLNGLDSAFTNVQTMLSTTGARSNAFTSALQNDDALQTTLQQTESNLQDTDIAAASVQLAQAQTAMQAALLSASRMLSLSLADYLK